MNPAVNPRSNPDPPSAGPAPSRARQALSQEALQQVHSSLARDLVESYGDFLGSIIRYVGLSGPNGFREFATEREDVQQTFQSLGEDLRGNITKALSVFEQLPTLLQAENPEALSDYLMSKVQPVLGRFSSLIDQARSLYQRFARESHAFSQQGGSDYSLPGYFARLQVHYEDLMQSLSRFQVDGTSDPKPVDLNSFTVQAIPLSSLGYFSPQLNKNATPVSMASEELAFVFVEIMSSFGSLIEETNQAALASVSEDNVLYEQLCRGISRTPEGKIAKSVLFEQHASQVEVGKYGTLTFRYEIPKPLEEFWSSEFQPESLDLGAVETVLEEVGGGILFCGIANDCLEVEIALPKDAKAGESLFPSASEALKRRLSLSASPGDLDPAMTIVSLEREYLASDGTKKTYSVSTPGAALVTRKAARQFAGILEAADLTVRELPRFCALNLMAFGDSASITRQFKEGNVETTFGDVHPSRARERAIAWVSSALESPFDWEPDERSTAYSKSSDDEWSYLALPNNVQPDQEMLEALSRISESAHIVALGLKNDYELHFETEEDQLAFTRKLIVNIGKTMDDIVHQTEKPIHSLYIIPVMADRVAHVGSFDGVFGLEVRDEDQHVIAGGYYSREEENFKYKVFDQALLQELVERVVSSVEEVRNSGKVSFRRLDSALQAAQVELAEDVLLEIVEQYRYASEPKPADRDSVTAHLETVLRDENLILQRQGEKLILRDNEEDTIVDQGPSYGTITQLDGSNPEEVVTFIAAKKLFEEGHPTFTPSARFFKENNS